MVQGPFSYEALPPSEISFVPLKQSKAFNAAELMQVRFPSHTLSACRGLLPGEGVPAVWLSVLL